MRADFVRADSEACDPPRTGPISLVSLPEPIVSLPKLPISPSVGCKSKSELLWLLWHLQWLVSWHCLLVCLYSSFSIISWHRSQASRGTFKCWFKCSSLFGFVFVFWHLKHSGQVNYELASNFDPRHANAHNNLGVIHRRATESIWRDVLETTQGSFSTSMTGENMVDPCQNNWCCCCCSCCSCSRVSVVRSCVPQLPSLSKKMDSSERARPSKYAGHAQRASEAASEFPSLLTVRNATANASPDTERLHMFAYSIVLLTYCPYFHHTNLGLFIFKKE